MILALESLGSFTAPSTVSFITARKVLGSIVTALTDPTFTPDTVTLAPG